MNIKQIKLQTAAHVGDSPNDAELLDAHVVILTNYIRKHHVVAYKALSKRVRQLTILLSVPMEPDRSWDTQWEDLDVRVQKNWMFTTNWRHSSGFKENNFIHIPIDTNSQLKSLKPDIVFSYEMGMRTLFSSWYRRFHRRVPLVMVGNMSQHIEKERGMMRWSLRWMIRRGVDYFTYNGPSCKRYLESLSISQDRLFHIPYCIDPDSIYVGERLIPVEQPRRLVYCGALSSRKGILQFMQALQVWCQSHSDQQVEFAIAGTGELKAKIEDCATSNLTIDFLGNCDNDGLQQAYAKADICVFPSLADEWGLVPIEGMASGLPVLGSVFAQSVEAEVSEGVTGWKFDPTDETSLTKSIDQAMKCTPQRLHEMGAAARKSISHITGAATANKFCDVIRSVLPTAERRS